MLSWSQRQKFFLIGVPVLLIIVLGTISAFVLRSRPDCTNGKKDGNESGADCGGSCRYLCQGEAKDPIIHFTRALRTGDSTWSAVAYVENRNKDAGARQAPFVFKLYDTDNILVYERHGKIFIPPFKSIAIFEGGMEVGSRIPVRALFEFTAPPRFENMSVQPELRVQNKHLENGADGSRLEATIFNPSLRAVTDIYVSALLFDAKGNVTEASATEVKSLPGQGTARLAFTWQKTLQEEPARTEILYSVGE